MGDTSHKCNAGLEKLDIKFDGTVLPCPAFKELDIDTMKKLNIIIFMKIWMKLKHLEEKDENLYAKKYTSN